MRVGYEHSRWIIKPLVQIIITYNLVFVSGVLNTSTYPYVVVVVYFLSIFCPATFTRWLTGDFWCAWAEIKEEEKIKEEGGASRWRESHRKGVEEEEEWGWGGGDYLRGEWEEGGSTSTAHRDHEDHLQDARRGAARRAATALWSRRRAAGARVRGGAEPARAAGLLPQRAQPHEREAAGKDKQTTTTTSMLFLLLLFCRFIWISAFLVNFDFFCADELCFITKQNMQLL